MIDRIRYENRLLTSLDRSPVTTLLGPRQCGKTTLARKICARMSGTFLLLGSASPQLIENTSETLAGRTEFVDLSGFDLEEVGGSNIEKLWFRGGFPKAYLAEDDVSATAWLEGFTRTFPERDLPQLGHFAGAAVMRKLWMMLASI